MVIDESLGCKVNTIISASNDDITAQNTVCDRGVSTMYLGESRKALYGSLEGLAPP